MSPKKKKEVPQNLDKLTEHFFGGKPRYFCTAKNDLKPNPQGEPFTFISASGHRVTIMNDPSPEACERFIRCLIDIKANYDARKKNEAKKTSCD